MKELLIEIILPALFAALMVRLAHSPLIRLARAKDMVDKPDARKLNRTPVPLLGGMGTYIGVLLSMGIFTAIAGVDVPFIIFVCATFMLLVGVADDLLEIPAMHKLFLQIFTVCILMFLGGYKFDNLFGLWGIFSFPDWFAYPLTLIACVGLLNAINMIDGVDGLLSGFGIIVSVICGIYFNITGNVFSTILAFSVAGALLPFFFFNVFGRRNKMFLGDAGSLFLGLIFSYFCIEMDSWSGIGPGIPSGTVALILAIFSVPVFDTLRVMTARIIKGRSPFAPDKTHLHHIFIDMGCTHAGAAFRVLCLNLVPVLVWAATYFLPYISVDVQFYLVVLTALCVTSAVYYGLAWKRKFHPEKYQASREHRLARQTSYKGFYGKMRRLMDGMRPDSSI